MDPWPHWRTLMAFTRKPPDGVQPVPSVPGLFASRSGEIWTNRPLARQSPHKATWREKKQWPSRYGYKVVALSVGNVTTNYFVHRLVLEAFKGPCPVGMEGCHNDGDKANNHIDNLRWDTRLSNMADRVAHGTSNRGESNGMATVSDAVAAEVKADYESGKGGYGTLAKKYGIKPFHVRSIVKRRKVAL